MVSKQRGEKKLNPHKDCNPYILFIILTEIKILQNSKTGMHVLMNLIFNRKISEEQLSWDLTLCQVKVLRYPERQAQSSEHRSQPGTLAQETHFRLVVLLFPALGICKPPPPTTLFSSMSTEFSRWNYELLLIFVLPYTSSPLNFFFNP